MRSERRRKKQCLTKRQDDEIFSTGEFHSLAVDDEVGQLLRNLPALLLVLRKVKLLAQLHVKHLQEQADTGHEEHVNKFCEETVMCC